MGMTREEIITGLELIAEQYKYIVSDVAKGAIALLKAQEPVEPVLVREGYRKHYNNYKCPICGDDIYYDQQYCAGCGRQMKWDD